MSRGGLKLAGAIDHFGLNPAGAIAIDVGASTGGFTDVLLAHDAAKVYAVDVGHGQLAWKLRQDPRVVVLEKQNARHLTEVLIPERVDWVVCDASFIGLRTVLPAALSRLKPGACRRPDQAAIRGRTGPGRQGRVVREPELHAEVVDTISDWFAAQPGVTVLGVTPSPIKGPEGNVEFLIAARFADGGTPSDAVDASRPED
ncbi:TlyA family RNA methyltransferase [Tistrella bauzanensis]